MPLPPYIKERLEDPDRYQTVYAKENVSAAAPTAGLHFTKELLAEIEAKGVELVYLTLHVGLGTFRPVSVDKIEEHQMHSEFYRLTEEAATRLNQIRQNGGKIVAVVVQKLSVILGRLARLFIFFARFRALLTVGSSITGNSVEQIGKGHCLSSVGIFGIEHSSYVAEVEIVHIFHKLTHLLGSRLKFLLADAHFFNHCFDRT